MSFLLLCETLSVRAIVPHIDALRHQHWHKFRLGDARIQTRAVG